jgi:hypothetical protein
MTVLLYDRQVQVDVNLTRITDLRVAFKVEKTLKREPNTLDLTIYNLAESTRKALQESGAFVRLQAGYPGAIEQIFTGDAVTITHSHNGADWITRLQSADGSKRIRTARVSESFSPGTSIVDVAKNLARATGLLPGNSNEKLSVGSVRTRVTEFFKGYVASGNAADELDKVIKTMGLAWSVQDGAIQIEVPGEPVGDEIVLLNATSGLIGSPEAGEKGIVKARSLIQQRLVPGRCLRLQSASFDGFFKVMKTVYSGDNRGGDWFADLELLPVQL